MLFISHDLAVVGYLADEIAVVYLGHLVELAPADALFKPPHHPYTEALLSAIPSIQPGVNAKIIHLEGDIPSPSAVPAGCPFHTRCIHNIGEICASQPPPWRQDERTNKGFSCHLTVAELHTLQDPAGSFS